MTLIPVVLPFCFLGFTVPAIFATSEDIVPENLNLNFRAIESGLETQSASLADMAGRVAASEGRVASLETTIQELNATIQALNSRIAQMEEDVVHFDDEIRLYNDCARCSKPDSVHPFLARDIEPGSASMRGYAAGVKFHRHWKILRAE